MEYEDLNSISRTDALRELDSGDPERSCRALVRIALHEPESAWVEPLILRFMNDNDPFVRGLAATCAGHLARIHRKIDDHNIVETLRQMLTEPATSGRANDALEDIEIYVGRGNVPNRG